MKTKKPYFTPKIDVFICKTEDCISAGSATFGSSTPVYIAVEFNTIRMFADLVSASITTTANQLKTGDLNKC